MNEQLNKVVHELSAFQQSFHSYNQLLQNPSITINHKKLAEVCGKCAKNCLEARNLLIGEKNGQVA